MYLTSEQLTIANQAVVETFEQTCIAWQAIPHWNTCDPGASRVRNDIVDAPGFLRIRTRRVDFRVTLAQTHAPTPDSLIAEVNWAATELARKVDDRVIRSLRNNVLPAHRFKFNSNSIQSLLNDLINARAKIENAGYRAPACLITNTRGLKDLSKLSSGYPITNELLTSAHVNSLHRASQLFLKKKSKSLADMLMLGRRQLIAHAGAPDASPGEEPVDLAVSVPPSLEVLGETTNSRLELSVRIRFALRIKDRTGFSELHS